MKTSKTIAALLGLTCVCVTPLLAKEGEVASPASKTISGSVKEGQAKVQIAILLDTSSSMQGLIEQAKSELWSIVNTFNSAHKNGQAPYVEVALYEYGKQSLNSESHWQRCIVPFSRDLDQISEELFKLNTNGGEEYCGAVIQRAVEDMKWDEDPNTYKAIFIAGNEPFTQGPVNVTESCQAAKKKGVYVNSIHCGNQQAGVQGGWNIGPVVAGGSLLTIDHNAAVAHIDAPQDKIIIQLNVELNKTYIPYGKMGAQYQTRQTTQDANAISKSSSGAHVKRAVSKASQNYCNVSWDLVDACKQEKFDWSTVKEDDLPEAMKKMTVEERKVYVAENAKQREAIQEKIRKANEERLAYIAKVRKELAGEGKNTLDKVVVETVKKQAAERGYSFQK
ncbi:hypothetical protein Rhal01_00050 [Rubritalea halochordaticola]|uniref:VWFA domain-containing protein n=1 Tax=Rubritalea halochordaticola TaxID=714537 RepID=A0ABP9UTV0_9BACT